MQGNLHAGSSGTCGGFSVYPLQDYPFNGNLMATYSRLVFLIAIVLFVSVAPSVAEAYYQFPAPTQNYYQFRANPAQPPATATLAPRPIEPMQPIAPSYYPSTSYLRPSYAPSYVPRPYNPYQLSPYSPYSGSNVADYVLGTRKPYFIAY